MERLNHIGRPDRAWEVWNENYSRDTGARIGYDPRPWRAWHPDTDLYPYGDDFASVEEALAWVDEQIQHARN